MLLNKKDIKWIGILIIILFFCAFYLLKIYGYFDFSSKYGIESISCTQLQDNALFVIDDDVETTWGLLEEHNPGEMFLIRFTGERVFHNISIHNVLFDKYETKKMNIYVSQDEIEWILCERNEEETEDKIIYILDKEYRGKYLKFEYVEEESGFWPITEVIIE